MKEDPQDALGMVGGALAHPGRRAILMLLEQVGPLSPGEIAQAFPGLSRQAVSKQLGVLRRAGLVSVSRRQRIALRSTDSPERQALALLDAAQGKGVALLYALDKRPIGLLLYWLGQAFGPAVHAGPPDSSSAEDLG